MMPQDKDSQNYTYTNDDKQINSTPGTATDGSHEYNGGDHGRSIIGNEDSTPFTITQHFDTPPPPSDNGKIK